MALPDRNSLLDLDWLTRTQAAETGPRLRDLVRDAADVYGGPVTAIAEALHDLSWPARNLLQWIDLRHGLAHALASGSWSSAPTATIPALLFAVALSCIRIRVPMFRQNPPVSRSHVFSALPRGQRRRGRATSYASSAATPHVGVILPQPEYGAAWLRRDRSRGAMASGKSRHLTSLGARSELGAVTAPIDGVRSAI